MVDDPNTIPLVYRDSTKKAFRLLGLCDDECSVSIEHQLVVNIAYFSDNTLFFMSSENLVVIEK